MLTNVDDPTNVTDALKHEATDYLLKSEWSLDEIVKKIKGILA
jgi:DNA-binding NarL/FixJ family response regulator